MAADSINGRQIWKLGSEGAVPMRVTSLPTVSAASPTALTNINGRLFFAAGNGVEARDLWATDGTPDGTKLAYDFMGNAANGNPSRIVALNGRMILTAASIEYGTELWAADFAATGDFNMDTFVDAADHGTWRATFGSTSELSADGNRDGVTDAADYVLWRKLQSTSVSSPPGAYKQDGEVEADDYDAWRASFDSLGATLTDGNDDGFVDAPDHVLWRKMLDDNAAAAGEAASANIDHISMDIRSGMSPEDARDLAILAIDFWLPSVTEFGPFLKRRIGGSAPIANQSADDISLIDFPLQPDDEVHSVSSNVPINDEVKFQAETDSVDPKISLDIRHGTTFLDTDASLCVSL